MSTARVLFYNLISWWLSGRASDITTILNVNCCIFIFYWLWTSSFKPYMLHGDLTHKQLSSAMTIHNQYGVYFESQRYHIISNSIFLVFIDVRAGDLYQILKQMTYQCANVLSLRNKKIFLYHIFLPVSFRFWWNTLL